MSLNPFDSIKRNPLDRLNLGVAWVAARLPDLLSDHALFSKWYQRNGYHKFKLNDVLDCKGIYYGYGKNANGYKVVGYTPDGNYHLVTKEGRNLTLDKWNVEYHFIKASSKTES